MGIQTSLEAMTPGPNHRESTLLRKLQATKESPLCCNYINIADNLIGEEEKKARKELETQKACIVAQIAPIPEEPEEEKVSQKATYWFVIWYWNIKKGLKSEF